MVIMSNSGSTIDFFCRPPGEEFKKAENNLCNSIVLGYCLGT
jgi:hypothetical protein